jgi:hypothetical protein
LCSVTTFTKSCNGTVNFPDTRNIVRNQLIVPIQVECLSIHLPFQKDTIKNQSSKDKEILKKSTEGEDSKRILKYGSDLANGN